MISVPLTGGCLLLCLLASPAWASPAAQRPTAQPRVIDNFAQLATMRPRSCPASDAPAMSAPGWSSRPSQCAWQGRLSMHSWIGHGAPAGACVGNAAQWWAAARPVYGAAVMPSLAWHSDWSSQVITADGNAEKRLAIIRRATDGTWSASEWIWHPSDRPATRRWQEGRWNVLVRAAAGLRQAMPSQARASGIAALQATWGRNLGARAGEIGPGQWRWQAAGLCMRVDLVGVTDGKFRLPYLIDDSRLEQRAAMQLQLARRYPDAIWLKTFRPAPIPAAPDPGTKYEAIWQDRDFVHGQLWIPTKGGGPVLRLRLSTPRLAGSGEREALAVERELAGLAQAWGKAHE